MKKNVGLVVALISCIVITATVAFFINNNKKEDGYLSNDNVQEKIGVNLKWFSAAYLGEINGWPKIYNYKNVTGNITIPGVKANEVAEIYELEGAKSKENIRQELGKYVDSSKFNKFIDYYNDFLDGLTEYDGKVYWLNGGIGDAPDIDINTARVISSNNGVSKVTLQEHDPLGDVDATITLTVEYRNGKYIISNWSVEE